MIHSTTTHKPCIPSFLNKLYEILTIIDFLLLIAFHLFKHKRIHISFITFNAMPQAMDSLYIAFPCS